MKELAEIIEEFGCLKHNKIVVKITSKFIENKLLEFGGKVKKGRWIFHLSKKNKSVLLSLIDNLKDKKYQAILTYYNIVNKTDIISKKFNFKMYQDLAGFTATYPKETWLYYLSLGLTGESGEVAEKAKKVIRDYNGNLTEESATNIFKEISDLCWYLSNICRELQQRFPNCKFNYEDVHKTNIEKLFDRFIRNKINGNGDNR